MSEFMESYELVAFAFADEAEGGHEIIAGAVHGGERARAPSACGQSVKQMYDAVPIPHVSIAIVINRSRG